MHAPAVQGRTAGTQELAAMALATTLSAMVGKIPLMALCGAVDTLASQAQGAGQPVSLIFQRAVCFLTLHCLPISALFVAAPSLLAALGQPAEMAAMVRAYLLALLPNLWIDAVARWAPPPARLAPLAARVPRLRLRDVAATLRMYATAPLPHALTGPALLPTLGAHRPLNRILVAQRITQPQATVSLVVAAQHVGACYLLISRFGYLGAAAASVWSSFLSCALLAAYVGLAGKGAQVWGRPSSEALRGWRAFGGLAYASAGEPRRAGTGLGGREWLHEVRCRCALAVRVLLPLLTRADVPRPSNHCLQL